MSESLSARDYQVKSFDLISDNYRNGHKKVLLWLATGGGKTFIFCTVAKRAFMKGKRVAVVVRGRKLVDQASKRMFREGVPHGVMMAGHWNYRPNEKVQVCSIDTLRARNIRLDVDLLIIDEAHLFTSQGDRDYLAQYGCFMLAVTATPYCDSGLRHLADVMVKPTSMLHLVDNGYLVPFRYFAPSDPDLSGVKINKSSGDYVSNQLEDAMVSGQLSGKIVESWKEIANGLKSILFAVNISHSKSLTQKFIDQGIRAEHCDADTPDDERENIIKRLENGEIDIICNVGIFCTGVDIPDIKCVIMARPTTSLNLYVQQAGRGTRPAKGKDWCILIDHAGNIKRHGLPTDEPDVDLDGKIREKGSRESKQCKLCFGIFRGSFCPECGPQERPDTIIEIVESNERLVELQVEIDPVKRKFNELLKEAKKTNKRPLWASYKLIDYFGLERARPYLTPAFIDRYTTGVNRAFAGSSYRPIGKDRQ